MQEKAALQKAMQQKNMMVLYRDELGAEEYAGIPVSVEDQLTVLQRQSSFALDGYIAMRTGDITMAEQMDDCAFCRRALEGEGVYAAVKPAGFPCRNWQELLGGIAKRWAGWVSIICEGEDESLCYVGKIVSADSRYLGLRIVDADGNWQPDAVTVPLDDLTEVGFGDRYLGIFQKYCKD